MKYLFTITEIPDAADPSKLPSVTAIIVAPDTTTRDLAIKALRDIPTVEMREDGRSKRRRRILVYDVTEEAPQRLKDKNYMPGVTHWDTFAQAAWSLGCAEGTLRRYMAEARQENRIAKVFGIELRYTDDSPNFK